MRTLVRLECNHHCIVILSGDLSSALAEDKSQSKDPMEPNHSTGYSRNSLHVTFTSSSVTWDVSTCDESIALPKKVHANSRPP
jgi:hypothetical protein